MLSNFLDLMKLGGFTPVLREIHDLLFFGGSGMNDVVRIARIGRLYRLIKLTKLLRVFKIVKESSKFLKQV